MLLFADDQVIIADTEDKLQQWRTQEFLSGGGSTNSFEDRVQREWGSGGGSPIVRCFRGNCNLLK